MRTILTLASAAVVGGVLVGGCLLGDSGGDPGAADTAGDGSVDPGEVSAGAVPVVPEVEEAHDTGATCEVALEDIAPDEGLDADLDQGPDTQNLTEDAGPSEELPPQEIPTTLFRDGTEEVGLPTLMVTTASLADVNDDGHLDLLVGARAGIEDSKTELYLGGSAGFEAWGLAERVASGPALLDDVVSSSIVDVNGDGRADLLLGGFTAGRLQVLLQRADGQSFDSSIAFESATHPGAKLTSIETADLDGNGLMDLYLGLKWPSADLSPWEETHANATLLAIGSAVWGDFSDQVDGLHPCHTRQTFAAQVIPREVFGLPSLLHVANDMTMNCLWHVTPAIPFPQVEAVAGTEGVLDEADYSMGTDWYYDGPDGDVVMASVEIGMHLMYSMRDDVLVDERERLPAAEKDYMGWSGVFLDADNDGDNDLVMATGRAWADDQLLAFSAQWMPIGIPAEVSRLLYYRQEDDGQFSYDNAVGGALFEEETGEYYGIAVGDLNGDGCQDLVVTLRDLIARTLKTDTSPEGYSAEQDAWEFRGPGLRVLLNNCMHPTHDWAALRVPDRPGSVVRVTLSDGTTRYQAVKGMVGTGSRSGGGILHFGLGPDLAITGAELFAPGGASIATITDVPSNQVTPLSP